MSPRCDAAERGIPSGAMMFAQRNFIENEMKKITPKTPTNESGLPQLIMMGESIRQIWVNFLFGVLFCHNFFSRKSPYFNIIFAILIIIIITIIPGVVPIGVLLVAIGYRGAVVLGATPAGARQRFVGQAVIVRVQST